jgi:circadian clock protein KaiB
MRSSKTKPTKKARRPAAVTRRPTSTAEFEKRLDPASGEPDDCYVLRLYITGNTPRSTEAIANIRALCAEKLDGRYDLEVIDIYQQPAAATGAQIIAAPTLIKKLPSPLRRLIGDLSNRHRVLAGLNISDSSPPFPRPAT